MSRCSTCDDWYLSDDKDAAKVHAHPEPQSGEPRRKLMEFCFHTGMGYKEWVVLTEEGKAWDRESRISRW